MASARARAQVLAKKRRERRERERELARVRGPWCDRGQEPGALAPWSFFLVFFRGKRFCSFLFFGARGEIRLAGGLEKLGC